MLGSIEFLSNKSLFEEDAAEEEEEEEEEEAELAAVAAAIPDKRKSFSEFSFNGIWFKFWMKGCCQAEEEATIWEFL